MKKKILLLSIAAALFLVGVVGYGQEADSSIISIENGVLFGYNINASDVGAADEISIHLTVADNVQTAFCYIAGDGGSFADYTLLQIEYYFNPRLGLAIAAGSTGAHMATGAGMFFNVFRREIADTVVTILKLSMDYLVDMSIGIDGGTIAVGIAGKIGL